MTDFLVKRDDLRETRVSESPAPPVGDGQALLRVDSFGLTANNVTYAVMGDAMNYWGFFPAGDEWGVVPTWGFAEVVESKADGVEVGTRVYGYLPPSTQMLVEPGSAGAEGFVDRMPHKAELPSAYHRYLASDQDPFYDAETEAVQMLLRPLFFTSFLIDDQLADDGLAERGPILMSSASSKTAIAAAHMLARREGVDLIALTSPGNVDFVEGLGLYGRVVPYEEIGELDREPATYVDFSGNPELRRAVHERFEDDLLHDMAVGVTHWEDLGDPGDLPGPAPAFFFAPTRVTKRSEDWGPAVLEQQVAEAWHPFCAFVEGWLEPLDVRGFDGVEAAWGEVLEGRVTPDTAHVVKL